MSVGKRISELQFYEAVHKAIKELVDDEVLSSELKLIVPLMGVMFASKMEHILFDDNEGEN